jgi:hypothetical protein
MRRASNSIRDGHANASSPPRQISSANANSSQIPHRWIVKPHGNCLSSGMVVVRIGPSPMRLQPRRVRGLGPVHGSIRGVGERSIDPHGSQLASTWDVPPNVYPEPGGRPTPAARLAAIIDAPLLIQPPAQNLPSWPARRSPGTTSWAPI